MLTKFTINKKSNCCYRKKSKKLRNSIDIKENLYIIVYNAYNKKYNNQKANLYKLIAQIVDKIKLDRILALVVIL